MLVAELAAAPDEATLRGVIADQQANDAEVDSRHRRASRRRCRRRRGPPSSTPSSSAWDQWKQVRDTVLLPLALADDRTAFEGGAVQQGRPAQGRLRGRAGRLRGQPWSRRPARDRRRSLQQHRSQAMVLLLRDDGRGWWPLGGRPRGLLPPSPGQDPSAASWPGCGPVDRRAGPGRPHRRPRGGGRQRGRTDSRGRPGPGVAAQHARPGQRGQPEIARDLRADGRAQKRSPPDRSRPPPRRGRWRRRREVSRNVARWQRGRSRWVLRSGRSPRTPRRPPGSPPRPPGWPK